MRYAVLDRSEEIAAAADMAAALAVVRGRIGGMAPHQAAMAELEIVKRDDRGRVRRRVSGRALVALALGVPEADLYGYGWLRPLDDAVRAGGNVEIELVPDGTPHERGRWWVVARYDLVGEDGAIRRDKAVLWRARSLHEAEEMRLEAELHLAALEGRKA